MLLCSWKFMHPSATSGWDAEWTLWDAEWTPAYFPITRRTITYNNLRLRLYTTTFCIFISKVLIYIQESEQTMANKQHSVAMQCSVQSLIITWFEYLTFRGKYLWQPTNKILDYDSMDQETYHLMPNLYILKSIYYILKAHHHHSNRVLICAIEKNIQDH